MFLGVRSTPYGVLVSKGSPYGDGWIDDMRGSHNPLLILANQIVHKSHTSQHKLDMLDVQYERRPLRSDISRPEASSQPTVS